MYNTTSAGLQLLRIYRGYGWDPRHYRNVARLTSLLSKVLRCYCQVDFTNTSNNLEALVPRLLCID